MSGNIITYKLAVHVARVRLDPACGKRPVVPVSFRGVRVLRGNRVPGAQGTGRCYAQLWTIMKRAKKPPGLPFSQTTQMPAASSERSGGPITRVPVRQRRPGSSSASPRPCHGSSVG